MLKCPKCGSTKINQFRMPIGEIWCVDCGYRVEHKETFNPFIEGLYKVSYGDKIRSMNDQELAEFFGQKDFPCPLCPDYRVESKHCFTNCKVPLLKGLRKDYVEDDK